MSNLSNDNFKHQYENLLITFLIENNNNEVYLNEAYKLGRLAVLEKRDVLSIVAIHHYALINFLQSLVENSHLKMAEKASILLEETLSPFQLISNDFSQSVKLLNNDIGEFAVRMRSLQDEIKTRTEIEKKLTQSLNEKEILLKEVYHRVKNNLQVISSLLNLQLEITEDPKGKKVLQDGSARVKTMALVHEMLYQSGNLTFISMKDYIQHLLNYLLGIYSIDETKIHIEQNIENIGLNLDQAIPCGLIINELLSNAFKYAFPAPSSSSQIKIILKKIEDKIQLEIIDNGQGINDKVDIKQSTTLGMKLIHSLTKQLGGEVILIREGGTHFNIIFKDEG